ADRRGPRPGSGALWPRPPVRARVCERLPRCVARWPTARPQRTDRARKPRRSDVVGRVGYRRDGRAAHIPRGRIGDGPAMVARWTWIVFGAGNFFQARTRPAQVMLVKPDGSDAQPLTTGPGNTGFPSWSP